MIDPALYVLGLILLFVATVIFGGLFLFQRDMSRVWRDEWKKSLDEASDAEIEKATALAELESARCNLEVSEEKREGLIVAIWGAPALQRDERDIIALIRELAAENHRLSESVSNQPKVERLLVAELNRLEAEVGARKKHLSDIEQDFKRAAQLAVENGSLVAALKTAEVELTARGLRIKELEGRIEALKSGKPRRKARV